MASQLLKWGIEKEKSHCKLFSCELSPAVHANLGHNLQRGINIQLLLFAQIKHNATDKFLEISEGEVLISLIEQLK